MDPFSFLMQNESIKLDGKFLSSTHLPTYLILIFGDIHPPTNSPTNTPNPISPWLPGTSGVVAALVMWSSAFSAGRRVAEIAHDELYKSEWSRAIKFSYWFAIALYPLFGVSIALGWASSITAIDAMGTAIGATPMLSFCFINLRG